MKRREYSCTKQLPLLQFTTFTPPRAGNLHRARFLYIQLVRCSGRSGRFLVGFLSPSDAERNPPGPLGYFFKPTNLTVKKRLRARPHVRASSSASPRSRWVVLACEGPRRIGKDSATDLDSTVSPQRSTSRARERGNHHLRVNVPPVTFEKDTSWTVGTGSSTARETTWNDTKDSGRQATR